MESGTAHERNSQRNDQENLRREELPRKRLPKNLFTKDNQPPGHKKSRKGIPNKATSLNRLIKKLELHLSKHPGSGGVATALKNLIQESEQLDRQRLQRQEQKRRRRLQKKQERRRKPTRWTLDFQAELFYLYKGLHSRLKDAKKFYNRNKQIPIWKKDWIENLRNEDQRCHPTETELLDDFLTRLPTTQPRELAWEWTAEEWNRKHQGWNISAERVKKVLQKYGNHKSGQFADSQNIHQKRLPKNLFTKENQPQKRPPP